MFCSNCGQKLIDGAAFCTNCGTAVATFGANVAQGAADEAAKAVADFAEEPVVVVSAVEESLEETAEEALDLAEEVVEATVDVAEDAGEAASQPLDFEAIAAVQEVKDDLDVVVTAVEDADVDDIVEAVGGEDAYVAEVASNAAGELAPEYEQMVESLEAAVQANEETIRPIREHAVAEEAMKAQAEQAAAQVAQAPQAAQVAQPAQAAQAAPAAQPAQVAQAAQPAQAAGVGAAGAAVATGAAAAAGAAAAGSQAYQAPEPPQSAQPTGYTMPFYQQGASPTAHYSSQRSYEENAYGQNTGQPGQPGQAWQQAQQAAQQVWPPQSATKRAFMMTLYVAGLIGLIICLVVRDQDDEFITHHLNNNAVLCIGFVISALTSAIFVGVILGIYLLVMLIMGIVSAYNGDMKELPLIGKIHIIK